MNEILEVYHAGTDKIPNPDTKHSRPQLDFGPGFYVTDIYEQAVNWSRKTWKEPVVNKYLLHKGELLSHIGSRARIFTEYDESWLDFIVGNRNGENLWEEYDYIEGGVADDRVVDTIDLYMTGFIPREEAIERLRYLKPNNQICISNQELIYKFLVFKDSEIIELP